MLAYSAARAGLRCPGERLGVGQAVKILIDTNIVIPLEPTSAGDLEPGTERVVKFAGTAQQFGCTLYIHPASRHDIQRDGNEVRRRLRSRLVQKYASLPDPPPVTLELERVLGAAVEFGNDWVDNHLLAALSANAVDWLVTEDQRIHRKARRLGLQDRVFIVGEAIAALDRLFAVPAPPPAVRATPAYALKREDPIFASLREDYGNEFDPWLEKCAREHRQAWVIQEDGRYAALCIVNEEKSEKYGLAGRVLKICTFKVSRQGLRYGELMLKTVFDFSVHRGFGHIFVQAFEKHSRLLDLLADFGFEPLAQRTERGELVLAKPLAPGPGDPARTPLDYNRRFGPRAVLLQDVPTFLIPIQPKFHAILFPELETQLDLLVRSPAGNGIRKAYLCRSQTRRVAPGDNLLFYRSQGDQEITVLGVVEGTFVSTDPNLIASRVGKRTVYSFQDISDMCARGEVLVLMFRQARNLAPALKLADAVEAKLLKGPPQSIVNLPSTAGTWLAQQIDP